MTSRLLNVKYNFKRAERKKAETRWGTRLFGHRARCDARGLKFHLCIDQCLRAADSALVFTSFLG
jgi:hypothetical protein